MPTMEATIEVTGLRKRFGTVEGAQALDGMTFTVAPGQVTGFVGPNGAGKSTTMRVILGLDAPDEGTALVGGKPYRQLRHPLSHLGALLDAAALQPSRSARNHLLWLAHSQGLSAKRVDEVLTLTGLTGVRQRKAGGYSLGMRQRLGIAAALLGDPPVLMMDEPFNGMDPEGIAWMRTFLRGLAAEGRAVLVSSHLMSELQDTADHLVVAGRGKVIADTSVAALIAAASGDRVRLRTPARAEAMGILANAGAEVAATAQDVLTIAGLSSERVVATLTAHHVPFAEVSAHRATLEEAYMELTRDAVEFHSVGQAHGASQHGLARTRTGRGRRHDHDRPLPLPGRTRQERLHAGAARGADQVPHGPRLDHRRARRRPGDGRRRAARLGRRAELLPGGRCPGAAGQQRELRPRHLLHPRPERRAGVRQLLLRPPAARRRRQRSPSG